MKKPLSIFSFAAVIFISACGDTSTTTDTTSSEKMTDTGVNASESNAGMNSNTVANEIKFIDLNTGQDIQLRYDTANMVTVDMLTGKPVQIYVNTATMDTFDTRGININSALARTDAGWTIDKDKVKIKGDKMKIKSGDLKIKTDGDEIKVKDGDSKMKADNDESKTKTDDLKIKEKNGETKMKDR